MSRKKIHNNYSNISNITYVDLRKYIAGQHFICRGLERRGFLPDVSRILHPVWGMLRCSMCGGSSAPCAHRLGGEAILSRRWGNPVWVVGQSCTGWGQIKPGPAGTCRFARIHLACRARKQPTTARCGQPAAQVHEWACRVLCGLTDCFYLERES